MKTITVANAPISSVAQMTKIDQKMVEDVDISIKQMMEKATQATYEIMASMFPLKGKTIVILAGKGNNGGDGIGTAIHLKKAGANPIVILSRSQLDLTQDSQQQLKLAQADKIPIITYEESIKFQIQTIIRDADYLIDALIGYNLKGNPREPIASLIRMANESKLPILSIDLPTGLSPDKGKPSSPTIKAAATLCLSTIKKGIIKPTARKFIGKLYLSNLTVPDQLYRRVGISYQNPFDGNLVVKVNL